MFPAAGDGVRPVRVPGDLHGGDDGGRDEEEGLRQCSTHLREAARAQGRQGRPHLKVFQAGMIVFERAFSPSMAYFSLKRIHTKLGDARNCACYTRKCLLSITIQFLGKMKVC